MLVDNGDGTSTQWFSNGAAWQPTGASAATQLVAKPVVTKIRAVDGGARITVSLAATPQSVTVTSANGATTYQSSLSGNLITVGGLVNGTAYTFKVTATFQGGSATSETTASVTPRAGIAGLNPDFWLEARLTTFANGNSITNTTDSSGNGWLVKGGSQTLAKAYNQSAADPTFSTNQINTQPVFAFSGAAAGSAQYLWTSLRPDDIGAQCTIFVVGKVTSAQNASTKFVQYLIDTTPANAQTTSDWLHVTTAYSETESGRGVGSTGTAINVVNNANDKSSGAIPPFKAATVNTAFLASITMPGTVYFNGAAYAVALASSVGTGILATAGQRRVIPSGNYQWSDGRLPVTDAANYGGTFVIGTAFQSSLVNNLQGQIAAVLIFSGVLTQTQRWAVEAALAATYGLTVTQS